MDDLRLYEHTQSTNVCMVVFVVSIAVISLIVAALGGSPWVGVIPSAGVAVPVGRILFGASALTVTVTPDTAGGSASPRTGGCGTPVGSTE